MIPEPCKYTPDVSFVNVTFFNISAFVNSWKRCQPCFNGAQKRTAFKEMAHHRNSQNHKRCQKAAFSLYRLAPGNAGFRIAPSYVPVPADVSLHVGTQRGTWSCQGCPGEGEEPDVSPPKRTFPTSTDAVGGYDMFFLLLGLLLGLSLLQRSLGTGRGISP